jgi:hypothetical protein
MRQRTREHELKTLSERDFANRIPAAWVVRAGDADDYGIDRQVEIFEDGRPTGLEFYVQLKATDQNLPQGLALSLPVKHRDHYPALALPVLMVRFHAPSGRMFAKWFHTYDPHYAAQPPRENAKTFTFRWHEADEWTDATPERLKAEAAAFRRFNARRLDFPIAFHVESADGTVSAAEALLYLRDTSRTLTRIVGIEPGPAGPGKAMIRFEPDRLVASFAGISSVSLHRQEIGPAMNAGLAADAFAAIALALLHIGHPDAAAQIFASVGANAASITAFDVAHGAFSSFALSGRTLEALCLARLIGERGDDASEIAEMTLAMTAMGEPVPEEAREEYRAVMRARAGRRIGRGDLGMAGSDYYNIGNSFRASHNAVTAALSYVRAARLEPDYRKRAYFNHEVAGMLFMTDHFELAAAFYRRALEIGGGDSSPEIYATTRALYADSLMYAGRYAEAEAAFAGVVEDENGKAEWRLKHRILPVVRDAAKADRQVRRRQAAWDATEVAIRDEGGSREAIKAGLRTALTSDALTEDAWYWLALLPAEDAAEEAAEMMLVAALARRHDPSAWTWAFALEWYARRRESQLLDISVTGGHLAGQQFRKEMLEWARHDKQRADQEVIIALLAHAETIYADAADAFVLRIPLEKGLEEITVVFPDAR